MSNFTKYHLCKRCHKELADTSPKQRHAHESELTLAQQIEQQRAEEHCASCYALIQIQEHWKPLPLGASVDSIFFVPDKPEAKEN